MRKAHKAELKKSLIQLRILKKELDLIIDKAEEKANAAKHLDDVYFSLISVEDAIKHLRKATA